MAHSRRCERERKEAAEKSCLGELWLHPERSVAPGHEQGCDHDPTMVVREEEGMYWGAGCLQR